MVYEACKYRAWLQFGERVPDPSPKTAMERGNLVHQMAEDFVRGKRPDLPVELKKFETEFTALRREFVAGKVSLEGEWAFDSEWNMVDWMDKLVWVRVKADSVTWLTKHHVLVVDYKTGKRFGNEVKHGEQMQLYLLSILLRYPEVELVTVELWYTDLDELVPATFTRAHASRRP